MEGNGCLRAVFRVAGSARRGYCEERIHIYYAELSEAQHEQDQDPDENVYPVVLTESEVVDGIRKGTIFDAKTLSAWAAYKLMK